MKIGYRSLLSERSGEKTGRSLSRLVNSSQTRVDSSVSSGESGTVKRARLWKYLHIRPKSGILE